MINISQNFYLQIVTALCWAATSRSVALQITFSQTGIRLIIVSFACTARLVQPWHLQPGPQCCDFLWQPRTKVLQPRLHEHPLVRNSMVPLTFSCRSGASQSIVYLPSSTFHPEFSGRGRPSKMSCRREFLYISLIQHVRSQWCQRAVYDGTPSSSFVRRSLTTPLTFSSLCLCFWSSDKLESSIELNSWFGVS